MTPARVIGTVVATKKYETLKGVKLLIIQPLTFELKPIGKPLVATDSMRAGVNDLVFFVKAREAAIILEEKFNPSDAGIVGIIDQINYKKDSRLK